MTRRVELRDAREQLVEIEHRRHVAADLRQRLERLGVARGSARTGAR